MTTTTGIFLGLACLAVGGLTAWLLLGRRLAQLAVLESQLSERKQALEGLETEAEQLREQVKNLSGAKELLEERDRQHAIHRQETETLRKQLEASKVACARLETQQEADKEKLSWLEQAEERMRELSEQVLSKQREAMTEKGKEVFGDTLQPFRQQMKEFRERIDSLNQNATKERTELRTEIKSLHEQTGKISSEATELTQALKGDSQLRGAWGEVTLKRVLEMSGLEEGREYQMQQTFTQPGEDGEGTRIARPDVIVRLPDERDIVIDAKLTLNDWIDAANVEDDGLRKAATKRFIKSVEAQIDRLAKQQYHDIPEIRTLSFTFMYIPIEPAYVCVMREAPDLVGEKAFRKHVALVSPTTLLPLLRIVENIWRLDRQSKNSQKIAEEASKMLDKFSSFVESLKNVGKGLDTAQANYAKALNRLESGRGNLLRQAAQIKKLGVNTKKPLPEPSLAPPADAD